MQCDNNYNASNNNNGTIGSHVIQTFVSSLSIVVRPSLSVILDLSLLMALYFLFLFNLFLCAIDR